MTQIAQDDAQQVRATFYLRGDQLDDLDILMLKIRTQHRIRVGKSDLIRMAVDRLLSSDVTDVVSLARSLGARELYQRGAAS